MSELAASWDAFADEYRRNARLSTEVAHYGPDIPSEAELRLLGDLNGKRVLELGCGAAQCSIAFARAGARPVGVDISPAQLAHARQLAEEAEVKVELRQGDMADLAFLRADSIDTAFSAWSFQFVEDLGRVFRQVHRVLKVGSPLVFSLPHPAFSLVSPAEAPRSYFHKGPERYRWGKVDFVAWQHTFSDLYMGLVRSSYRVDLVLEPEPLPGPPRSWLWTEEMERVPRTLIMRARKEGN
jgi:SAM-dependent methyltransferase